MPRAKRGEKAALTEEPALGISADELTAICEVRHAASHVSWVLAHAVRQTQSCLDLCAGPLRWELEGGLLLLGCQAQSSCCSPSRLDCRHPWLAHYLLVRSEATQALATQLFFRQPRLP